jgi:hypothetical protein
MGYWCVSLASNAPRIRSKSLEKLTLIAKQYEKITVPMVMLGVVSFSISETARPTEAKSAFHIDFPHEHARSRAFRWGEDGIAGVSDTHGLQNIAFAFWNEEE